MSVPDGVTTEIVPVVAPAGTVAWIYVSDTVVNDADIPLNVTLVDPVRPLPKMRIFCPTLPTPGAVSTNGLRRFKNLKTEPSVLYGPYVVTP